MVLSPISVAENALGGLGTWVVQQGISAFKKDEQLAAIEDAFTDCLTEALEEELPKISKDQRKEISDELKNYFRRDSVRSELVELALTVGLDMPDPATRLPGAETDLSPVGNTIFQKFIHFLPHHIRVEAQRPNSPLENLVKLADIEAIRISLENLPVQLSRELTRLLDEGTLSEHDSKRSLPGAPPPPPEFVGRDTKLDELEKSLAASRIVGIWGSGGIGKTSLVQAHCAKEEVKQHSVFWAEMTEKTEALQILLAWVRFARPNYEINPSITEYQTADEVRVLLTEFIANHSHHHALFIIDNIWENQIDVAQMILRCIPDKCPVMITTRQKTVLSRLQLSTKIIELDVLSDTEVDLLLDQQVKSIYFTPDHRANIKSLLDGHPIALVHAIKTLNQAGDSDDMDLIIHSYHSSFIEGQDIQTELEELYIDSPGLFAVLEYSYNQLGTEAKQCFRLLGILAPNSQWDKQLIEHLWPVSKSGSMIRALHTHALIDRRTDTLYAQHALLRSYALWQLRQCNEVDKAQLHYGESIAKISVNARDMHLREIQYLVPHIDWVGHILTNRLIELFEEPSEEEQAILIQFTECYLDFANSALTLCVYKRIPFSVNLASNAFNITIENNIQNSYPMLAFILANYYAEHGDHANAHEVMKYISLENDDPLAKAYNYYYRGAYFHSTEQFEQAESALQHTLTLVSDVANTDEGSNLNLLVLQALAALYSTAPYEHRVAEAATYIEQALNIEQANGITRDRAILLNRYALIKEKLNEHAEAEKLLIESIALRDEMGDIHGKAISENSLGITYAHQQRFDEAIPLFQSALNIFQQTDDWIHTAHSLHNLGHVFFQKNELEASRKYLEDALEYRRKSKDSDGEFKTLSLLLSIYIRSGDSKNVEKIYDDISKLCNRKSWLRAKLVFINLMMGNREFVAQNIGKAKRYYEKSTKYLNNDEYLMGITFTILSYFYYKIKDQRKFASYSKKFTEINGVELDFAHNPELVVMVDDLIMGMHQDVW